MRHLTLAALAGAATVSIPLWFAAGSADKPKACEPVTFEDGSTGCVKYDAAGAWYQPRPVWLIDAEVEPYAMFPDLAACEADRLSLGITSDEYFCAEIAE